MSRSVWKGPYVNKVLLESLSSNLNGINQSKVKNIQLKTQSRQSTIIPKFVGILFQVYNGKNFISLRVTHDMIGYKFGEFVPTRKKFFYKKTKNK